MEPVSLASPHASPDIQPLSKGMRARQVRHKDAPKASESNGVTKKKQSKSRNGIFSLSIYFMPARYVWPFGHLIRGEDNQQTQAVSHAKERDSNVMR